MPDDTARDRIHRALGITRSDLPISAEPLDQWTMAQLERANFLAEKCRVTYGVEEARRLWPEIGLPVPPDEIVDPLPGEQRRH